MGFILFCINTFTFMPAFVQIQFKGSSREVEPQVKQYDTHASNKLRKVKAPLKKSVVSFKKNFYSLLFLSC